MADDLTGIINEKEWWNKLIEKLNKVPTIEESEQMWQTVVKPIVMENSDIGSDKLLDTHTYLGLGGCEIIMIRNVLIQLIQKVRKLEKDLDSLKSEGGM